MAKGTNGAAGPVKSAGNEVRQSDARGGRLPDARGKSELDKDKARVGEAPEAQLPKAARRILNAIEWRAPRTGSKDAHQGEREGSKPEGSQSRRAREERQSDLPLQPPKPDADAWTVPASVKDRFAQEGRRYFFSDGSPAFRDHGKRLTTPSENGQVVATLIEIAQARGWDSIRVRGTERFRQEAWKQGRLAGVDVRGYHPSTGERAALFRAMAAKADGARAGESAPLPEGAPAPRAEAPEKARSREAPRRDEPIAGKLLGHGYEHYQFNPKADFSYYVRLDTPHGKRVLWGTDFERALNESLSQAKIGDEVVLRHRGTDAVTVKRRERDDAGKVVHETPLDTHRNTWSIERSDFLEARAAAAATLRDATFTPKQTVKKHPELAGTLLLLHAAELKAKSYRNAEDREAFLAGVRKGLADRVARGEPLEPVQIRTRARREAPEKVHAPER